MVVNLIFTKENQKAERKEWKKKKRKKSEERRESENMVNSIY